MTTPQETQRIVRTYHDAWVNGDFATAGSVLADELTNPHTLNKFDSSPMSRETYLANLKQFQQDEGMNKFTDQLFEMVGGGASQSRSLPSYFTEPVVPRNSE